MSKEFVESYAEAWLKHVKVDGTPEGDANLAEFLAFLSEDVAYEDIPSNMTYSGHEGVTQLSVFVSTQFKPILTLTAVLADGDGFALEFTMQTPGFDHVGRAVAVGTIADGKVTSHRDYYDLNSILNGPPSGPPGPPPDAQA